MARTDGGSIRVLFALIGVQAAAFFPFIPLVLHERGFAPDTIGFILAAMSATGIIASTVAGHVGDVVLGRLATFRLVAAIAVVFSLALFAAGSSLGLVLAAAAGVALANEPIVPLGDALAFQHLGGERREEFGRIRQWSSLGFAAAALAFGALFGSAGIGWALPTYALALVALLAWSAAGRLPAAGPVPSAAAGHRFGAVGAVLKEAPRLLAVLLAVLLAGIGATASFFFVPLRIGGLGGGPFLVGLAAALGASVEVPLMGSSRTIIRTIGLRGAFAFGCAAYVVVFLALSVLTSPVGVALVVAGDGVGFALIYISTAVIVDVLVRPELRATGQGLRVTIAFGLAPVIGTAAGGVIFANLGAPALFLGAAATSAAGLFVAWVACAGAQFGRSALPVAR